MRSLTLRLLRALVSVELLLTYSYAYPVSSHERTVVEHLFAKRAPQNDEGSEPTFAILGVGAVSDGSVHPRLEIRNLEQNEDQWNVFLLALQRFQLMSQSDMLSYYQISGIHGRPERPWDGVQQVESGFGGYCAHSSNLFPTWHRAYLALFEEIFYLNARTVVSEFSDDIQQERYSRALSSLRWPYWDWAAVPPSGEGVLPPSLQRQDIQVVMPNGTTTIKNPLYSFAFNPLNHDDFLDEKHPAFAVWASTVRDPSSEDSSAESRNNLIANDLDQNRANLQSRTYHMFTMEVDYHNFSNDQAIDDSLESVHNTIHNLVGSGGHMSVVAYASFDPIFWLHHANVDRYFAIWQALNPDSYVTEKPQVLTSYTTKAGDLRNAGSALDPFHSDDAGSSLTSDSVRSTTSFGYTYPELVDDPDRSALVSKVNSLYGPDATHQKRGLKARGVAGAPSYASMRQYICNIKVHKFALNGSFSIYIFVGDEPGSDPSKWTSTSSFVGLSGIFAAAYSGKSTAEATANGAVPLTATLEAKLGNGEVEDMGEQEIEEYLKNNLHWRVKGMDNKAVPLDQVSGLQVAVLWSEVQPAESRSEFPKKVGDYQVLYKPTDGRPGGFQKGDGLG